MTKTLMLRAGFASLLMLVILVLATSGSVGRELLDLHSGPSVVVLMVLVAALVVVAFCWRQRNLLVGPTPAMSEPRAERGRGPLTSMSKFTATAWVWTG